VEFRLRTTDIIINSSSSNDSHKAKWQPTISLNGKQLPFNDSSRLLGGPPGSHIVFLSATTPIWYARRHRLGAEPWQRWRL